MLSKTVEVRNSTGLHARPAACLAKAAKKYSCKVTLHYEGNDINATSMMNIMRAGIKGGKTDSPQFFYFPRNRKKRVLLQRSQ